MGLLIFSLVSVVRAFVCSLFFSEVIIRNFFVGCVIFVFVRLVYFGMFGFFLRL